MIKLLLLLLLASDCQAIVSVVNHNGDRLKVDGSGVTQPVSSTVLDNILTALGSVPVTGGFYQATQPVSIAATINAAITNATLAVTQSGAWSVAATLAAETTKVIGTVNIAAGQTIGVTGTFWQATQAVSGTFWQATQPVSGTFWQATQPVSGTFYQATQPVSLAVAPTTPVTGTFFQATQPVSLAVAPTTPVTGTFYQATQPISAASLPLPTGAATETTLAALNTRIATGYPLSVTPSTATLKSASFSITATGTIVAAVAGKRIKVYALSYISGGIASVNFRDGATTALEGAFAHAANSGRVENVNPPSFLFATTAGNSLDMVYSGAGTVGGRVSYFEE